VACTYDFEVAAAKYLHALGDGDAPLEFLFSGTVFYLHGGALRAAQIPWDVNAEFAMPARVWKDLMRQHFPHSAWLRLDLDTFDRLYAYKTQRGLSTWEQAVEMLLGAGRESDGPVRSAGSGSGGE
ncbi:MAG: DUF6084 family protein, partial [Micromonosporaceae bacterium]